MIGTNMEELKQYLKSNREIEFSYQNSVYTIEPGGITSNTRFSMWKSKTDTDTADCICEYTVPSGMISEEDIINDFLNTKCFEGKSFVEIETTVTVDVIDLEKHLPKKLLTEEAEAFAKKADKVADDVVMTYN